jgi:hypothetical protein
VTAYSRAANAFDDERGGHIRTITIASNPA